MIRAKNRNAAYNLINIGAEEVYRESIDTSIRLASDVLLHMGFAEDMVKRQAAAFHKYDEESLHVLATKAGDEKEYIFKVREAIAEQERILMADRQNTKLD